MEPSDSRVKVLVPIHVGTQPMEAVIVIAVLRMAGAHVTLASVSNHLSVDTTYGVTIVADALISDCADTIFDVISIPGGAIGTANLKIDPTLSQILKKHVKEGRIYGALGAAPAFILGPRGYLRDLKATCVPSLRDKLTSYAILVDSPVQLDGKAVSCKGLGTTMQYALVLVEQLFGKDKAVEVSRLVLTPFERYDNFIATNVVTLPWTRATQLKVLLPIADGVEEMEVVTLVSVLRCAKVEVVVASVGDGLEIMASHKVRLVADVLFSEADKHSYDLIVLPSGLGGAEAFANSEALLNLLKKQSEGEKATAFLAMSNKPVDPCEGLKRVVVDGEIMHSRGLGTSLDFSLAIVDVLFGREKALEVAKLMLV